MAHLRSYVVGTYDGPFYLKFFFGLGGLEIQPVEITLKESKEEFFKEMLKKFMG